MVHCPAPYEQTQVRNYMAITCPFTIFHLAYLSENITEHIFGCCEVFLGLWGALDLRGMVKLPKHVLFPQFLSKTEGKEMEIELLPDYCRSVTNGG